MPGPHRHVKAGARDGATKIALHFPQTAHAQL